MALLNSLCGLAQNRAYFEELGGIEAVVGTMYVCVLIYREKTTQTLIQKTQVQTQEQQGYSKRGLDSVELTSKSRYYPIHDSNSSDKCSDDYETG